MITGVHAIIYATDAEATRTFIDEVLGLASVDAGGGWPIYALPPAELAIHPATEPRHELFLMCDDIEATVADLTARGVEFDTGIRDQQWGLLTSVVVPGGGRIGLYEPRDP